MYIDKLAEAIVQEPENVSLSRETYTPDSILEVCGSLIMKTRNRNIPQKHVERKNGIITGVAIIPPPNWGTSKKISRPFETFEFSHFSVKEYLLSSDIVNSACSNFAIEEDKAGMYMSNVCLSFVL